MTTPIQLANALDEMAENPKGGKMAAIAYRQAAKLIRSKLVDPATEDAHRADHLRDLLRRAISYGDIEPQLDQEIKDALRIPCRACGGSGFSGYGTGYDRTPEDNTMYKRFIYPREPLPADHPSPDPGRSKLPLQYEDGPDYCIVKDAQGRDFALTMQPGLMKVMEKALSDENARFMRGEISPCPTCMTKDRCLRWGECLAPTSGD